MTPTPTVIHFTCHACGMALTVPLELAGASGPCPGCGVMITSPRPAPTPAPVPAPPFLTQPSPAPQMPESPGHAPQLPAGGNQPAPLPGSLLPLASGGGGSLPVANPPFPSGLPPLGPGPVPVPKALAPHPSIVVRDPGVWQPPPTASVASSTPPWPNAAVPPSPSNPLSGNAPISPTGTAQETTHPVLNHVLQAPSILQGGGFPMPLAGGAPSHPATATVLPTLLHQPGVSDPAARPRTPSPLPAGNRRHIKTSPSGKRGAMMLTVLMALLVLLGIGWFFRDQIRVAYITYTLQHAPEEGSEPATPSAQNPPASAAPTSPAPFSPAAPPVATPNKAEPAIAAAAPNPSKVPPAAAPSEVKLAPRPAPSAPASATVAPPQAMPPSGPPVTVLPPLPVTPEDLKAQGNRVDTGPAGSSKAEKPVALGPATPPLRIFETATPETQGAVEALKRFLSAPDWKEREKYVQTAEKVRPLMEQYYHLNPDGPITVRQIQLMRHDKTPNTGGPPHCVFQVAGGDLKQPLPVMVEEEGNNWKVDWLTFTEFKDDLLQKFLESHHDEPKRFHVMMRRTHYFDEDVPGLDKLTCFEIQPPMPGFAGYVFVRRATPLAQELDRHVGWEVSKAAAIVELQWRKEGTQQWVELTGVPQYNWRNPAAGPAPVKAQLVE